MYLKITKSTTKQGIKRYAKIVESVWDSKKQISRQRIVLNLGPILSEEDHQRFKEIADSLNKGKEFVDFNKIELSKTKEIGVTYVTNKLLEKFEINRILKNRLSKNRACFDVYKIIKALIIGRLVEPASDLSTYEWICEDYSEKLDIAKHQIYRALDYLVKEKKTIEKELFNKLKLKFNLDIGKTYYDLTSSYFEGNCCPIALFGYSRDHRKDRRQIVIGLVMCDGIPIMHEVHKGNTADKTTLANLNTELITKFGIKKTIIVADSGLMTKDNINCLETTNQEYIIAHKRRKNKLCKKLFQKKISLKNKKDETQFAKVVHKIEIKVKIKKEEKDNKNKGTQKKKVIRRYILCLDSNTKKERLDKLNAIKENVEKKLAELQKRYLKSQKSKKGKKITKESLICQAYKIVGKNKRLFNIEFQKTKGLVYSLNEKSWNYEKKIAGKFLLMTNSALTPTNIMKTYKQLQDVERAFNEIKNFLKIRPIGHHKTTRVKAHVFVCVLSFLIECIINKQLSTYSARNAIRSLKRIRLANISVSDKQIERKIITKLSDKDKKIFKEMDILEPISIS